MDNKEIRRSEVDDILGVSDLMTLVELQKFLADELGGSTDGTEDFSRAFLPLTDGLGLENPPKRETPQTRTSVMPPNSDVRLDPTDLYPEEEQELAPMVPEKKPAAPSQKLDSLFDGPQGRMEAAKEQVAAAAESERQNISPIFADADVQEPPPMPQASFFRRSLAGVADLFFVVMLWSIALAITSIATGGSAEGLLSNLPKAFSNSAFLHNAMMEYAALWLGYFVLTVGLANATVGMWAWGMRVAPVEDDARMLKKLVRAFVSFLLVAPIAPALLLVIRTKGRNLIDLVSGTLVYRTGL